MVSVCPANPMQSLARVGAPVLRSQGLSPAPREGAKGKLVEAKGLRSICIKRPSSWKIGKVDEDNLYRMNSTGEEKRDVFFEDKKIASHIKKLIRYNNASLKVSHNDCALKFPEFGSCVNKSEN
ncbi:hypothetical protein HNY73_005174 [Argiope bruennichi]|uniref:Uncharacterized protein n=1 Tax=Argiope bruennichi TaxID=94029 RepID=A0A8T0FKM8_ARGBR|nr:hypothetical protein HNY73_005174 [Argiope bruennichi]